MTAALENKIIIKTCRKGLHIFTEGRCKECAKLRNIAWQAANREMVKAWRAANAKKYKEISAAWEAANREKRSKAGAAWKAANPERRHSTNAIWRAANQELLRTYGQNYRAKKLAAGGRLSKGISEKLFKLQQGKCACCKKPLGDNYHLDHIVPISKGGQNEDWNIQLLTNRCNFQKNAKDPIDFMQSRGFLI